MKLDISKINKKYVIIGIVILLIVGIYIFLRFKTDVIVINSKGAKFTEEYEELNGKESEDGKKYPSVRVRNNKMKHININEALDILDDGVGAIYIGYAECIYCRSAVQVLVDTAKKSKLEEVYYLDISEIWDVREYNEEKKEVVVTKEAHEKYDELLKELGEEYIEDYILTDSDDNNIDTDRKRVIAPLVIFVVRGDIVSSNIGTLFSQEDPYIPLDDDQVKGLSEIYSHGINDVLSGLKEQKLRELES